MSPSRKPFDLKTLPPACRDAFFKKAKPEVIIQLSVACPETKELVARSPVRLIIEDLDLGSRPRLEVLQNQEAEEERLMRFLTPIRSELTPNDFVVQRVSVKSGQAEGATAHEKIIAMFRYLCQHFTCTASQVFTTQPNLPVVVDAFSSQDPRVHFDSFELAPGQIRGEAVDMIILEKLADCIDTKELAIRVDLGTEIPFDGRKLLNFERVKLSSGKWLRGGELLELRCSKLEIHDAALRDTDINEFLKDWQSPAGGNRRLIELTVEKNQRIVWSDATLLDGVDVELMEEEVGYRKYILTRRDAPMTQATFLYQVGTGFQFRAWKWNRELEMMAVVLFGSSRPSANAHCPHGFTAYSTDFLYNSDLDTFDFDQ